MVRMNIGVYGYGFVGGATGQVFGEVHNVYPYDKFKAPFNTQSRLEELAGNADVVFLCVPTPMKRSGAIDYSPMHDSLTTLLDAVNKTDRRSQDFVLAIRSTAVSGTTDSFAGKYPFRFAFTPEFLREKHALEDMRATDRVVIGANDSAVGNIVENVYRERFPDAKYIRTDARTAEMIKYAANVMLASQITMANQLNSICEAAGVKWDNVKNAILMDGRIGRNLEVPGHDGDYGYGGKCFPKDAGALDALGRELGVDTLFLEAMIRHNNNIRTNKDWLNIPGATSNNMNFGSH